MYEVCVDKCGSTDSHLEDMCSKEIGLCLQITLTTLHTIVNFLGGISFSSDESTHIRFQSVLC